MSRLQSRTIYFLLISLFITFFGCEKKQTDSSIECEFDDHYVRLVDQLTGLQARIAHHRMNEGKYPTFTSEKLQKEMNNSGYNYYLISKIKYISDGKSYKIYILTKYRYPGDEKYAVAKIVDNKIYLKQRVAKSDSSIEEIDWDKIDTLIKESYYDKNGKYIKSTRHGYCYCPPE